MKSSEKLVSLGSKSGKHVIMIYGQFSDEGDLRNTKFLRRRDSLKVSLLMLEELSAAIVM
jgi:hypothetical protein